MPKGVSLDEDTVKAGYEDVRNDESETKFLMLTYQEDNTKIRFVFLHNLSYYFPDSRNYGSSHL